MAGIEELARRGGTGRYEAGCIKRSRHPVQVGAIVMPIGVESLDARRDDMTWEIQDKDDVAVGQVFSAMNALKLGHGITKTSRPVLSKYAVIASS